MIETARPVVSAWLDVRPDEIPERLRGRDQWVLWRGELRDDRPTKVPYTIAYPSQRASVDAPATWGGSMMRSMRRAARS